jgi:hypothetical protein
LCHAERALRLCKDPAVSDRIVPGWTLTQASLLAVNTNVLASGEKCQLKLTLNSKRIVILN